MNLGNALQKVRFEKKMTQTAVSKKAKITQTYLSLIEKGDKIPSSAVVKKLCKVYDIPEVALVWLGTEKTDVQKSKHNLFDQLKPVMDSLVAELLITKK